MSGAPQHLLPAMLLPKLVHPPSSFLIKVQVVARSCIVLGGDRLQIVENGCVLFNYELLRIALRLVEVDSVPVRVLGKAELDVVIVSATLPAASPDTCFL